jgi:hypothetical protein
VRFHCSVFSVSGKYTYAFIIPLEEIKLTFENKVSTTRTTCLIIKKTLHFLHALHLLEALYSVVVEALCYKPQSCLGARGSVVGCGTILQAGRSPFRVPDEVDFFNLPNPSSRTMALGSTQPLTEMSTMIIPGGKKRPARRADNLAAICEPIV